MTDTQIVTKEIIVEQTIAHVNRIVYENSHKKILEENGGDSEVIEVHKFATTPAKVHFSCRMTLNLGNYQSAQVHVGVEVPCYLEQMEEAYAKAKDFVETRTSKELAEIRETTQNAKPKT